MSYSKFERLKNCGHNWFDKIPEHWNLIRLRHCASILSSNVNKKTIEGETVVKLCNYVDVYYNDFITSQIDFMVCSASDSEINKFSLTVGDVVITKDSESRDDVPLAL